MSTIWIELDFRCGAVRQDGSFGGPSQRLPVGKEYFSAEWPKGQKQNDWWMNKK